MEKLIRYGIAIGIIIIGCKLDDHFEIGTRIKENVSERVFKALKWCGFTVLILLFFWSDANGYDALSLFFFVTASLWLNTYTNTKNRI